MHNPNDSVHRVSLTYAASFCPQQAMPPSLITTTQPSAQPSDPRPHTHTHTPTSAACISGQYLHRGEPGARVAPQGIASPNACPISQHVAPFPFLHLALLHSSPSPSPLGAPDAKLPKLRVCKCARAPLMGGRAPGRVDACAVHTSRRAVRFRRARVLTSGRRALWLWARPRE